MTISPWVGLTVALVLVIVVTSYRQNVHAYPSGGGDYEVATTNLGPKAGLTVASALLVDYVLTVAVSVSSGAQYAAVAIPALRGHEVAFALIVVGVLALMNLRGVKESGRLFAIPTYLFMFAVGATIVVGFARVAMGNLPPAESAALAIVPESGWDVGLVGLGGAFLVLRSFASGCAALTGVEAISNGVPAFKEPKSRNAATTLALLGSISITFMISILLLAREAHVHFAEYPATNLPLNNVPVGEGYQQHPVLGQLATAVFSGFTPVVGVRVGGHRPDPGARREHRLQRLPGARLDPRPRRVPAAPAAHAWRPACLLQRDRRAGGRRRRADLGLRRAGHQADPAVHRRRVRVLHAEPVRHGAALEPAPGAPSRTRRRARG